jgi:short subunit dehydrogenase-like uncharacterized protein
MHTNTFLLYGANGYTGELISRFSAQHNLVPVLAGRTESAIKPIAQKLGLQYLIFDVNHSEELEKALFAAKVIVNAAGPFDQTCRPIAEACIKTGTHYLDINGDIEVFEIFKGYNEKAKNAGVMLMPGVGFDVVPTDCLALYLKNTLPDASGLKLAFTSIGGAISHGTAITMASKMGEGGAKRINGRITKVPLGENGLWIDFPINNNETKRLFVMSIPWGDVSTAYFTTKIPNIETYTGVAPSAFKMLKFQKLYNWFLRTKFARAQAQKKIKSRPAGPSDEMREKAKSLIWGSVVNKAGLQHSAALITPEGYTLTYLSTLNIAKKVLEGNFQPGYQTPAKVFGADLILEIPGVQRFQIN